MARLWAHLCGAHPHLSAAPPPPQSQLGEHPVFLCVAETWELFLTCLLPHLASPALGAHQCVLWGCQAPAPCHGHLTASDSEPAGPLAEPSPSALPLLAGIQSAGSHAFPRLPLPMPGGVCVQPVLKPEPLQPHRLVCLLLWPCTSTALEAVAVSVWCRCPPPTPAPPGCVWRGTQPGGCQAAERAGAMGWPVCLPQSLHGCSSNSGSWSSELAPS